MFKIKKVKNICAILMAIIIVTVPIQNLFILTFSARNLTLSTLTAIILIPIILWMLTSTQKKIPLPVKKFINYSSILLAYTLFTCLWTPNFSNGFVSWTGLFITFVFVTLLLWVGLTFDNVNYFCFAYLIGCLIGVILVINTWINDGSTTRIYVDNFNPNWMAHGLVQGVNAMTLMMFSKFNISKRVLSFSIISVTVIGLTVFLLGSRGGLVAYTLALIGFILSLNIFAKTKKLLLIVLISCIVILTFQVDFDFSDSLIQRYTDAPTLVAEGNFSGRGEIWQEGLDNISRRNLFELFFGSGISSFREIVGRASHNGFINILFDLGIIGCIIYFMLVFHLIIPSFKNSKKWHGSAIIGSLTSSMLVANVHLQPMIWFTLGLYSMCYLRSNHQSGLYS